jgi:hypothetical protein
MFLLECILDFLFSRSGIIRGRFFICIVVIFALAGGGARGGGKRGASGSTDATTSTFPLAGLITPKDGGKDPTESQAIENPFTVIIRNCYLTDPDINPIGAQESREKGIRLVTTGSIRNNTERIIYRAGVYSKLVVYFGKNARYEKYSGGLGFNPPVTSSEPWRPGAWRDFEIVGRAFDPIYREYEPKALSGMISLEAKDPLGFNFSQEIAKMKPRWDTLFGAVVDQSVPIQSNVTVTYGPQGYKTELRQGDTVKIVAQQGGGYLAKKEETVIGWVPASAIQIRQYENMYPESNPKTLPATVTIPGKFEITVDDYKFIPLQKGNTTEGGFFTFHVKVKNIAAKETPAFHPNYFWMDEGAGKYSQALEFAVSVPDAMPVVNKMAVDSEIAGWIAFPRRAESLPFAIAFQPPKTAIPAIFHTYPSASGEILRKTIAVPEENQ